MSIFLQTGIIIDNTHLYDGSDIFYIEEFERSVHPYDYPGDSINYDIDGALVTLYDSFRDFYFY